MIKLKIIREYWMNSGADHTALVVTHDDSHEDGGKMCCLGFLAKGCGIPHDVLIGLGDYGDLKETCEEYLDDLPQKIVCYMGQGDSVHSKLIEANDSKTLSQEEKEKEITRLMKLAFVDVEFVNED